MKAGEPVCVYFGGSGRFPDEVLAACAGGDLQAKQLHQDLDYSMAQVMRLVIRMFLGLRENSFLQKVFDLFKVWAEK